METRLDGRSSALVDIDRNEDLKKKLLADAPIELLSEQMERSKQMTTTTTTIIEEDSEEDRIEEQYYQSGQSRKDECEYQELEEAIEAKKQEEQCPQ